MAATAVIHTANVLIGCLSIVMLGLVAHSVSLKDKLDYAIPSNLEGVGMSLLFWPACGGIVDSCLFFYLWTKTPFQDFYVSG